MSNQQKKALWIWYPGDFEIWLGNRFNNRRTERGAMFPPFWKQDSHWATVAFSIDLDLDVPEKICIATEGSFNLMLDGHLQFGMPETFVVPAGRHQLCFKVHNTATPPALFVDGDTVKSNGTWLATYEDKIWIDEWGKAHGSGCYVPAACWYFDDIDSGPSTFRLPRHYISPVAATHEREGLLLDFGRETMGYLTFKDIQGEGFVNIFYGESREEALDRAFCETLDQLQVYADVIIDNAINHCSERRADYTMTTSKAFRYIYIECAGGVHVGEVGAEREDGWCEHPAQGSFKCSDEELNRIWQVSAYTLELTTREFFVDGIKRDRWTWSGDAIQSYLMNYYLHFDNDCVRRTIRQLRGKDPVTAHINTIMDYTFYWFKSILDYHLYSGDTDFVREMYPRMCTLMEYCLGRANGDGMMEGQPDDWIFVDWVDFPMHKRGTLCFEQLLFCKALETMHTCAKLLGIDSPYGVLADDLLKKTRASFWSEERHAFLHAIEDGEMNEMVTKFPNMFAIIYGYADERECDAILRHVLLNEQVEAITTPYMRFYELEALCMMGMQASVLPEMKSYWGGMLREGATTFWEKYVPSEQGTQHLAMYGRPYGKSLCHAWGASPIYILGKYFLGVRPTKAGYEEYEVRPHLGGLEWMEGSVPTPFGKIEVSVRPGSVTVRSDGGSGTLILGDRRIPIPAGEVINVPTP